MDELKIKRIHRQNLRHFLFSVYSFQWMIYICIILIKVIYLRLKGNPKKIRNWHGIHRRSILHCIWSIPWSRARGRPKDYRIHVHTVIQGNKIDTGVFFPQENSNNKPKWIKVCVSFSQGKTNNNEKYCKKLFWIIT